MAYADYLKGRLWASIRLRVIAASPTCVACGEKAEQVHHSRYTYENLTGQSLEHLHPVCTGCHHKSEFHPDGSKRSLRECNELLKLS